MAERLLAWLAISGQLNVTVFNPDAVLKKVIWTVNCSAECAGTLRELEYGTSSADEPPVLAGIMDGSLSRLLLPTALAGPDLWMRATIDGINCVVAVQSKVESVVYSFSKFVSALKTLDPGTMYNSPSATTAKEAWRPYIENFHEMDYHRIVFSACGFTSEVQFAVREYNWVRGFYAAVGRHRHFIHLINLDDIKDCCGAVYYALKSQIHVDIEPTLTADQCILSHQWRQLSPTRRKNMTVDMLKTHCKQRGISLQKRRAHLVDAIDMHSADGSMVHRVMSLDMTPSFAHFYFMNILAKAASSDE